MTTRTIFLKFPDSEPDSGYGELAHVSQMSQHMKIDIAELGYISPGHGLKGKLNPPTGDDLEDMYGEYKNKLDIML